MKKFFFGILVGIFFLNPTTQAQNNTLFNMHVLHQSRTVNPALMPNCKFYLDLPASSVYTNFSISSLTLEKIFSEQTINNEPLKLINLKGIEDALPKVLYVNTNISADLFGFGFRAGNNFISFNTRIKGDIRNYFNKSFFELYKGNANFTGPDNPWDLGGFGMSANMYLENAIGITRKITSNLTVGANIKRLNGLANVDANQTDIQIFTDPDTYNMNMVTDVDLKVSAPVGITFNDSTFAEIEAPNFDDFTVSDYIGLIFSENKGWALDIGAHYDLTKKLKLQAALTDFGYIRWKNNAYRVKSKGEYLFEGFDVSYAQNPDSFTTMLTDTLKTIFMPAGSEEAYTTMLTSNLYLGANFIVSKNLDLGVLTRTAFYNKHLYPALTLSANTHLGKGFSLSASYSMMNYSYNNLGFGLAMKLAFLQLYLVSDNITAAINPQKTNSANIRVGLNFNFGCKKPQTVMETSSF